MTASGGSYLTSWSDNIGVDYSYGFNYNDQGIPIEITSETTNWTQSFTDNLSLDEDYFKVFLGEEHFAEYYEFHNVFETVDIGNANVTWDPDYINKTVTAVHDTTVTWPLADETVHVNYLNLDGNARITVTNYYNATTETSYTTVTVEGRLVANWNSKLMGRYEWTVVGRDAASVDSAGASLVTAAFKNKQVEIGLAGSDMYDPLITNQMPWVMAKMDDGNNWADYIDTLGRAALRDDWCKAGTVSGDEWPIASSNMIGVGGPLANGLAYYGNDYTNAFFGLDAYTPLPQYMNKIISLTCWNKNTYQSTETTGYAVISTYLDINGTELFLVWGHWGRDTYYATKWFHEEGVYQLQEAPAHLTDIVLKIQYESTSEGYKPKSTTIVESLGTISETKWEHTYDKGDIHPDP
jgi:hypothetical protein